MDKHSSEKGISFLAAFSHEMRGAMAKVVGCMEMLLDSRQGIDEETSLLRTVHANSRYLLDLLDSMAVPALSAADRVVIARHCDPVVMLNEVMTSFADEARQRGQILNIQVLSTVPRRVLVDLIAVRQVLHNLVSNAIKFGPPGPITISAALDATSEEAKPGAKTLRFDVHDEGCGLSTDEATEVFTPFYRGTEARRLQIDGAGLGLYICRRIVDGLGGSLSVSCGTPKGTTFTMRVPVEVPAAPADIASGSLVASEAARLPRLCGRVLLVEDDPAMQTIIRYYLESAGLSVILAPDGHEALKASAGCDLILMDLFLPQLNGRSTAAVLRRQKCKLPIIALTAATCSLAIDADLQVFADCVSKSAGRAGLLSVLSKYLPAEIGPTAGADAGAAAGNAAQPGDPGAFHNGEIDLTRNYVETFPLMVDELRRALKNRDVETLRRRAHRLMGTGGLYGFPILSQHAESLLNHLDSTVDWRRIRQHVTKIDLCAEEIANRFIPAAARDRAGSLPR